MKRTAIIFIAAALVLTACQSASEKLTEQILEEAVGGGDVDINTDTGEIKIVTDEGSISIGGGDLPDDLAVPLPDGYSVTSVFSSPDGSAVSVSYAPDRWDELVSFFDDWAGGQSGDWSSNSATFDSGDGQAQRSSGWYGETTSITVSDCYVEAGDAFDAVCVNIISG